MKLLKISFIALFIVSSFAACKKDKKPVVSIEGKWTGKGGLANAVPGQVFSFNIKPNEVLEVTLADGSVYTGKWKLDGTNFTANYIGGLNLTSYYKGTLDNKAGKLNGTWGTNPEANFGTWYMDKVK